jgi:LmbE family N-acetylglucosaminyl deacetylase
VGEIALDCVTALIGARLAFPELLAQGLEPHVVEEVRLMVWEDPDFVVDISETIELKIAALACHASQPRSSAGHADTPTPRPSSA